MNFCIIAVVLAQFAVISFADVIGGRDAVDGERPFQVALFAKGSFCGGALIHPRVVVTAAHCVVGKTVTHIRYNTLRRSTGPTIDVIRTIVFPDYNKETHEHDIALVILKEAFKPDKNARVIETVGVDAAAGSIVTLSGWGNTIAGGGVQESESLKVANLTEVDRQTCDKQWGNRNSISPYQICASGTTTSACNGDSGGPLTWNGKLYGIVSYGPKPCKLGSPSNVYTRVGSYLAFIKDNVDLVK